ncbi:hypothetical protein ACERK3_07190 [Phycisphaerales bacterium AB-hyl4]|uniref:Succinyl-diaminopimelate desuccinylase n=1 Tax=Natronomicrosphaera hydrolytica TaxID=3242702 RepID=A0ABV4U3A7_9BACT
MPRRAARPNAPASSHSSGDGRREKAHERVGKLERSLVRFASDFCAFDTSNPPGRSYKACCEFLQNKLETLGMATKLYRVPKTEQAKLTPGLDDFPRYNLVARWDVGAAKTLHFTGHYDVVPATSGWKTDPFSPLLKGVSSTHAAPRT